MYVKSIFLSFLQKVKQWRQAWGKVFYKRLYFCNITVNIKERLENKITNSNLCCNLQ
jgi:hypothetical protein